MNHQRPLNKIHNYQIIEGDDDGLISYVFMSSNGAYYSVYFNVKEYDQFTENYPNLFSNGYGLGIFRVTKPVNKIRKDIILFPTIEAILHDFISRAGKDVVLLFHCESSDGRQAARDKLFTFWFQNSEKKDGFIRDRFEAVVQETDIKHFMGYITSINNPNIKSVQLEFDACAFNLMQDKISQ